MSAHSLSRQTLVWARFGILLSVILTAIFSAWVVARSPNQQLHPQPIPIAENNLWHALGR